MVCGSMPVTYVEASPTLPRSARTFATTTASGEPATASPAAATNGVNPSCAVIDVVRRHLVLDRPAVRCLHPVGEHRDEGDEGDADHQRRRGRGGPAGVPHGVPARQLARGAADRPRRQADERCERTDEARRDHGHADEEEDHAARDGEQPGRGVQVVLEHRVAEQEEREPDHGDRDVRDEGRESRLRQREALAHGRDRRDARRANGREEPGHERDDRPDEQGDDDRASGVDHVRGRELEVERLEELVQPDWPGRSPRRGR